MFKFRTSLLVTLIILGISILFLVGCPIKNPVTPGTDVPNNTKNLKPNNNTTLTAAYNFELKTIEGNVVKLSDYKGKMVFLNFWATWCPPCKGEMPDLQEVRNQLKTGNNAVLLAVNIQEDNETVNSFVQQNNLTLPILMDSTGEIAQQYGIRSIPTTFVIDKDGNIVNKFIGAVTKDQLLKLVSQTQSPFYRHTKHQVQ